MATDNERLLDSFGFHRLARLMRAVRQMNFYQESDLSLIWQEQTDYNMPLLSLIAIYIHQKYAGRLKFFTLRDCYHLHRYYTYLFPDDDRFSVLWVGDRYLYQRGRSYDYYARAFLKDSVNPVFVSLYGTGKSLREMIGRVMGLDYPYEYFVWAYSDLDNSLPASYVFHRKDGYSDSIARINYAPYTSPKTSEYDDYSLIWEPVKNSYIYAIRNVWDAYFLLMMEKGYLPETDIFEMSLVEKLMRDLEKNIVISKYVDHDSI